MTRNPPLPDSKTKARRYRFRMIKDRWARHAVGIGGMSVIIAILLIFFYLFYVVVPMLVPASAREVSTYELPGGAGASTVHLELEELNEMAVRYTEDGRAVFFSVADGRVVDEVRLTDVKVRSVASGQPGKGLVALGLADGTVRLVRHVFKVSYPNDVRTITPSIEYPYGEDAFAVDDGQHALKRLAVRDGEEGLMLAAYTDDGRLLIADFIKEVSFLDESVTLQRTVTALPEVDIDVVYLLLGGEQEHLFAADAEGQLLHFQVDRESGASLAERVQLTPKNVPLTSLRFLVGGMSLLAGGADGSISQWFAVRDEHNRHVLTRIRSFKGHAHPVRDLGVEERRKGFVAVDEAGVVAVYHATSEREVLAEKVGDKALSRIAVSPRSNAMLIEDAGGRLHNWSVHNEHPEISWHALFEKVHYEGYDEPRYIWQSSSASNDFEAKFSLVPLAFGTLKAAMYAMLLAVPLAIFGAIYTAYFMAPRMRSLVKPTIEIMEALPTVILGFLAGLWLAPVMEEYLPGVFSLLVIMPLGILVFAFIWRLLPPAIRHVVPAGWEAALLIPVIVLLGWGSFALSMPLENLFFGGDMRAWLYNELGLSFDQRNALVVGLAMGFAVIPTIFSIAEDAIFSVPKHLTFGSLALGASPWQTMTRVVILTASPGIFSAVMIGIGRAVGETMIVLMATGNTPVMDMSIFQGMRTLSANIAVEMPESAVNSTHYRILFLAGLLLFLFTFIFNTLAEVIRQRLRRRYASL